MGIVPVIQVELVNQDIFAAPLRHQDIIRAYARWAPIYDFVFGAVMANGRRRAARAVPAEARDVVELGVGTGLSLPYYRRGCRIVGVDLSPDMLDCARRLVAKRRLENVAALVEMDACDLDFDDNSFDAAVSMHAVTCVPDPQRLIGEACRVVRPGGRVIIVSRFAAEGGVMAALGSVFAPIGRWLGFSTKVTASSLSRMPQMRLVAQSAVGIAGYYRLLEFEVVKPHPEAG